MNIQKNKYNFSIIVEQDVDGFYVYCPQLQGCYTQGDSYEEAMENIKDAIRLHLEDRVANKEEVMESIKSISLSSVEIVI